MLSGCNLAQASMPNAMENPCHVYPFSSGLPVDVSMSRWPRVTSLPSNHISHAPLSIICPHAHTYRLVSTPMTLP